MKGIFQLDFTRHARWLRSRVPYIRTEDTCGFVAYNSKSQIVGAVIFDNFLHSCAQITLVIDSPQAIKLGLLDFAADFIFNVVKKKFVYAMVAGKNIKSLRLCDRVGFEFQMLIPDGYAEGVSMYVFRLEKNKLNLSRRKKVNRNAEAT